MTENSSGHSWLKSIAGLAHERGVPFPAFIRHGMGSARTTTAAEGRFVTFKRRLVAGSQAAIDGIEWTLWREDDGTPFPVVAFRESNNVDVENLQSVFSILEGWLLNGWTLEETRRVTSIHPRVQPIERLTAAKSDHQEYWLSADQSLKVIVTGDRWSIYSRERCLTAWQDKASGICSDHLELSRLDDFCSWIAKNWWVIAYGHDVRPSVLRSRAVSATRAYENADLARATESNADVSEWWSRHAIRAADLELPNLFFERQSDQIIISWDATPSEKRLYRISPSEDAFRTIEVISALRKLVGDRLHARISDDPLRDDLKRVLETDSDAGYATVLGFNPTLSKEWLRHRGFDDEAARELATSGISRHPVVGLLRSSQGTTITRKDCETIWKLLRPGVEGDFGHLRELAKGLNSSIDTHEPWQSGYQLARIVRDRLRVGTSGRIDVESVIKDLGVTIVDASLSDNSILGACVGTSRFSPIVILNSDCEEVRGISGRRVTLAHELCHLLFDRGHMQSLARFEGGAADSDRLIEMRANAFAIELLVPMETLVAADGTVVGDDRLKEMSVEQQVSLHALIPHATNLRNRLAA